MGHIVQPVLGSLVIVVGLSGCMPLYLPSYQHNCIESRAAYSSPEEITRALPTSQKPIYHPFQLHTYSFSHCALIVLPIFIIIFIIHFSFLNKLISCSKVQIPEFASSFIFRRIWLYINKEKKYHVSTLLYRSITTFEEFCSSRDWYTTTEL